MNWFDKAVEELEDELDKGLLSQEEFREEMRCLRIEFNNEADAVAEKAREDYIGW